MSLTRARIIKSSGATLQLATTPPTSPPHRVRARRIPALVVDARAEAVRILGEASATAAALLARAEADAITLREGAAREAREQEIARVSAELIALRVDEERRAERGLDRTITIAALLAERLVGEALVQEPARIRALAEGALRETRGARQLRVEACAEDAAALRALLPLGEGALTIEVSTDLARGSLVLFTELGGVDARLAPQLGRLAEALRETLRDHRDHPRTE